MDLNPENSVHQLPAGALRAVSGAQMSRRKLMGLGLGAMTVSMLAACGVASGTDSEGESGAAASGGTLTLGIDSTSGIADPAFYTSLGDWMAVDCALRGLTFIDFNTTEPQPDLAESWDISDDKLTYTFHLRQGVTFHDGTPFTAADVVRSYQRQFDEKDPTLPKGSTRPLRGVAANLKSMKALDEATFEMVLKAPDNILLSRLSDIGGRIISAAAIEKHGQDIGKNLVGTGPFKLVSATSGQNLTFEAFEGYYKGRPVVDRLVLQQVQDSSAIISSLMSGDLSATQFVPYSAVAQLKASDKTAVADTPMGFLAMMVMDVRSENLKELEVRQAINFAINRKEIVERAFFGTAVEPAGYAIPPSQQGHDPSLADLSAHNPEKAKQLLESVGAVGRTVSLIAASDTWHPLALQIIEQNLKDVGLNVTTELVDPASYSGRLFDPSSANHELMIWERNSYVPDPDNMIGNMGLSTSVYASFVGGFGQEKGLANFDADLAKARNLPNGGERTALYSQIQRSFVEKVMPIAMLAHGTNTVAMGASVKNLNANALSTHRCFPETASV